VIEDEEIEKCDNPAAPLVLPDDFAVLIELIDNVQLLRQRNTAKRYRRWKLYY